MAKRNAASTKRIKAALRKLLPEMYSFESKAILEDEIRFQAENLNLAPWLKKMVQESL